MPLSDRLVEGVTVKVTRAILFNQGFNKRSHKRYRTHFAFLLVLRVGGGMTKYNEFLESKKGPDTQLARLAYVVRRTWISAFL
jgi:hypothetical protein